MRPHSSPALRTASQAELESRLAAADVLEEDPRGPKVARLADGSILKLFRSRHRLTRDLLRPAALRFSDNSQHLEGRGITAPTVLEVYLTGRTRASAVRYLPVPGHTLTQHLRDGNDQGQLLQRIGSFIALLHQRGIYFRSLHSGNIVLGDSEPGLIDVLDLRFLRRPLGSARRQRNWRHFARGCDTQGTLDDQQRRIVLGAYAETSGVSGKTLERLHQILLDRH